MLERTIYHTKGDKHCTSAFSSAIEWCSQQYQFTVILKKVRDMYSNIIGIINDHYQCVIWRNLFLLLCCPLTRIDEIENVKFHYQRVFVLCICATIFVFS